MKSKRGAANGSHVLFRTMAWGNVSRFERIDKLAAWPSWTLPQEGHTQAAQGEHTAATDEDEPEEGKAEIDVEERT